MGFEKLVYQKKGFSQAWGGNDGISLRCLLSMPGKNPGAFGALLYTAQIDLEQMLYGTPKKLFENRFWGDLGFIHCCLDINGMHDLKAKASHAGYPFTLDNDNRFDMGEASGYFCYLEDGDGPWIKLVETHEVPIFEKFNWYLQLKFRNPKKNRPVFLVKMLALNRMKN